MEALVKIMDLVSPFSKLSAQQGLTWAGLLLWAPGEALPTSGCSHSFVRPVEPQASESQAGGYLVPLLVVGGGGRS